MPLGHQATIYQAVLSVVTTLTRQPLSEQVTQSRPAVGLTTSPTTVMLADLSPWRDLRALLPLHCHSLPGELTVPLPGQQPHLPCLQLLKVLNYCADSHQINIKDNRLPKKEI